jgi:hypothetical protein
VKLFHLRPNPGRELKETSEGNVRDPFTGYDIRTGFVIRAESEEQARNIAAENTGDEVYSSYDKWLNEDTSREELKEDEFVYYDGIWTNENLVECTQLDAIGEEEIILSSYRRG